MTREHPVLSPEVSALLDKERELPPLPALVRARGLARARAAVLAAGPLEHTAPLVGRWKMHWAVAATLTSLASVAVGAAAYHVSSRWDYAPPALSSDSGKRMEARVAALPNADGSGDQPRGAVKTMAILATSPPPYRRARANESELRILRLARAAVAREDFEAALRSIGEHTRRFPDGGLVEEREALHVKALAGLNRAEDTRRAASVFRRRFPNSILLSAVDQLAAGQLRAERRPP